MSERIPPSNLFAERAILASMLISKDVALQVMENLHHSDFYSSAHQNIFIAIVELITNFITPDIVSLCNVLQVKNQQDATGGEVYISELIEENQTSTNPVTIEHWCKMIQNTHVARDLIQTCHDISCQCYEGEDVTGILKRADDLITQANGIILKKDEIESIGKLITPTLEQIEQYHTKRDIIGVTTGLTALDEKTAGYQKGDLILNAARPGMGKTALMLTTALNGALISSVPALIFSLEMSKTQLTQRLLAIQSGVDLLKMRAGRLDNKEYHSLGLAAGTLHSLPIYIDTSARTVPEIRAKVRRMKKDKNIGTVYLDYLQLMPGEDSKHYINRNSELEKITRSLKHIAEDYELPVILLSQLSRAVEQRGGNKKPLLSDLRDSGAIEQDADVVVFVYRAEHYNQEDSPGIAELLIGKQRNGPVGKCTVAFVNHCATFKNLETELDWTEEPAKPIQAQEEMWQNEI